MSIGQLTSNNHDLTEIRQLLSAKLEYYYLKMKSGHYEWLKRAYVSSMYRSGKTMNFKIQDDTIFSGKITGIDEQGKLLIFTQNRETLAFGFREIMYVI